MESTPFTLLTFDELDSTNDYVKRNWEKLPNHTVVQALFQSKGRGQFERVWESEAGKNLLCSILIKEVLRQEELMSFIVNSVIKLLSIYDIKVSIKEPNDIMIGKKKIAGILIERLFEGQNHLASIIGLGLNVNQTDFQETNATSMAIVKDREFNLSEIINYFLSCLETPSG